MFILLLLHNFPSVFGPFLQICFIHLRLADRCPSAPYFALTQHSSRPHSETRNWQLLLYETWLCKWTPHILAVKIFMMFIKPFFSSTFVTVIMGIWIMNSVTTILLSTVGKCLLSQFVPHDFKLLRSHSVLFSFQTTHCKQKLFTTLIGLIMTRGRFLSLTEKNPPLRFHSLSP